MPSIIPGFEYDIFVSYRQKDNKGGHWVTDFVEALRNELESTFKEDISIYFDENPHDGLLETHDVSDSLKEKLKCLIFIPIISHTYCDPKSFAWQHEFLPFVTGASSDRFGLKIKLNGGNVAGRIIPIRIHELDKSDVARFESVAGSMRPVDFVYKTSGVNRPLLPREEHPNENQIHIIYRDQINKLANAIRDMIGSMSKDGQHAEETLHTGHSSVLRSPKESKRKLIAILAGSVMLLALIAYLIIPFRVAESPPPPVTEESITAGKSIAVLPFQNLSGDKEQEYFSDGVAEEILNALSKIKDLKVAGRTSSFRFKGDSVDIHDVGDKLKVSTVLEGSVRKQGNKVRISVRLLNVEDGFQLWSEQFESSLDDMFKIQEQIAIAVSDHLKVTLLQNESLKLRPGGTLNTTAYDAVLKGRYFWERRMLNESERYFKLAIELDSNYAAAYVGLAETYVISPVFRFGSPLETMPKAEEAAEKALEIDPSLSQPYFLIGLKKANFDWDREAARTYFKQALRGESNYAQGYYFYAQYLSCFESDFSGAVTAMRKAVEIEPLAAFAYVNLGLGLIYAREFEEALSAFQFSTQLNNMNYIGYLGSGFCNVALSNLEDAQKDLTKAASLDSQWAKAMLVYFFMKQGRRQDAQAIYDDLSSPNNARYSSQYQMASAASFLGKKDLAHEHFKRAFQQHDNILPYLINHPVLLPGDALSDPRNMALMEKHFPFMKESKK